MPTIAQSLVFSSWMNSLPPIASRTFPPIGRCCCCSIMSNTWWRLRRSWRISSPAVRGSRCWRRAGSRSASPENRSFVPPLALPDPERLPVWGPCGIRRDCAHSCSGRGRWPQHSCSQRTMRSSSPTLRPIGRPAARDRAGRGKGVATGVARQDGASSGGPASRQSGCAGAATDDAQCHRLESRPTLANGAGYLPAAVGVRQVGRDRRGGQRAG